MSFFFFFPFLFFLLKQNNKIGVVVEGGDPSVYNPASFKYNYKREEMLYLIENILLSRLQMRAPAIFICLGHQMVCEALVHLLRKCVRSVAHTRMLKRAGGDMALSALKDTCELIHEVGKKIEVQREFAPDRSYHSLINIVARGYEEMKFGVSKNERTEEGETGLFPYRPPLPRGEKLPRDLIIAHQVTKREQNKTNKKKKQSQLFSLSSYLFFFSLFFFAGGCG
jgi:hypothetical protein